MSEPQFDGDTVTIAARSATGRPYAIVAGWATTPASHRLDNMTTASLDLVRGTLADDTPFELFVKTLHPAFDSPIWPIIPEFARSGVLADLDWLDEPRAYRSALGSDLPAAIRLPHLWHVVEADRQIQLWLESIDDSAKWDSDGYHSAAAALGALSGRWSGERVTAELGFRRRALTFLWFGKGIQFDLPRLADDAIWRHAAFNGDPGLRADLNRVVDIVPSLIERLESLPDALVHGDACPANLLRDDGGIVAIDWSYASNSSIGSDLGQLLAGRFVDGSLDPNEVEVIAKTITDGFVQGLASEGASIDEDAIELAFVSHLLVRAVFDALASVPDVTHTQAVSRVALARFAVERALMLANNR